MATVDAFRLSIPFVEPFATSVGTFERRELIVVAYESGADTGWGEHAPWPGQTPTDASQAWSAIADRPVPSGVALDLARLDHAARNRRRPLWEHLGGADRVPDAAAAVGMYPDPGLLIDRVSELVAQGVRAVKLKIGPGSALEPLTAVRTTFPELTVGLDANAAFHEVTAELAETARHQPAYIEQPFPPDRLDLARRLRAETGVAVVADEAVVDLPSAIQLIAAGAADVVTVKLGRVGPNAATEILDWAAGAGVAVKMSGLFETSIGRAHTLAFATLEPVRHLDFAPAVAHLRDDLVRDPWQVERGQVAVRNTLGIGVEADRAHIEAIAIDHVRCTAPDAEPEGV